LDKIKVLLFAMTGFGNHALKAFAEHPLVEIIGVFTPQKQNTPFPYYTCEQLQDLVIKSGLILYENLKLNEVKTIELIASFSPDLIVVCSFNQIIPKAIISIPRLGVINVHPSLLPKYRGATPTFWTLINGENETGATVHFIEDEKIDNGRIITQVKLKIEPSDTDGILRYKLARLSENMLTDSLNLILTKDKESFPPQNESEATYFPKRTLKDAEISLNKPFKDILNKIRATTPYPGAYLYYNGKLFFVNGAILINEKSKNSLKFNNKNLVVDTLEGTIKFHVIKVD